MKTNSSMLDMVVDISGDTGAWMYLCPSCGEPWVTDSGNSAGRYVPIFLNEEEAESQWPDGFALVDGTLEELEHLVSSIPERPVIIWRGHIYAYPGHRLSKEDRR